MASETSQAAVLVDLYPLSDNTTRDVHNNQIWAAVRKLLLNGFSNDVFIRVYVLTSSADVVTIPSELSSIGGGQRVEVKVLAVDDKIRAFYEAKEALDAEGITDIRLLCLDLNKAYWTEVCQHFFTDVHKWMVEDVTSADDVIEDLNQNNATDKTTSDSVSAADRENPASQEQKSKATQKSDSTHSSVVKSIKQFLTTLPSLLADPEVNRSKVIPSDVFVHGYSTRRGGITTIPPMSSMNLVYVTRKRDPLLVIEENRRRLAQVGGFDHTNFHIVRTEHGHKVWVVGQEQPDRFDGLVTNRRDVTIAAAGADCIPLLFADPVAMVIGAAHAGWKGTVEKVAACVVQTMAREFGSDPKDIRVAMGPCVLAGCFGVLPDEAKSFSDIDPSCVVPDAVFGSHVIPLNDESNDAKVAETPSETLVLSDSTAVANDGDLEMNSSVLSDKSGNRSDLDMQKSSQNAIAGSGNDQPRDKSSVDAISNPPATERHGLRKGRVPVDLLKTNRVVLEREGILPEHIDVSTAPCTRCNKHLYFSNERTGFPFGNQIGFICMPSTQK